MKNNLTELVFILDRSGSMGGLEKDTIGGFNSMLARQRNEPGEAYVSTILFDSETEVIHDRVPLCQVRDLTEEQYYVRGCTALLDAVGGAIHHIAMSINMRAKRISPRKRCLLLRLTAWRTPAGSIPMSEFER